MVLPSDLGKTAAKLAAITKCGAAAVLTILCIMKIRIAL